MDKKTWIYMHQRRPQDGQVVYFLLDTTNPLTYEGVYEAKFRRFTLRSWYNSGTDCFMPWYRSEDTRRESLVSCWCPADGTTIVLNTTMMDKEELEPILDRSEILDL